jgi:hypothetical protein
MTMAKNKATAHAVDFFVALKNAEENDLFLETSPFKNPARKVLRVFKASGPTQAVRDDAGGKKRPAPEGWLQDGARLELTYISHGGKYGVSKPGRGPAANERSPFRGSKMDLARMHKAG